MLRKTIIATLVGSLSLTAFVPFGSLKAQLNHHEFQREISRAHASRLGDQRGKLAYLQGIGKTGRTKRAFSKKILPALVPGLLAGVATASVAYGLNSLKSKESKDKKANTPTTSTPVGTTTSTPADTTTSTPADTTTSTPAGTTTSTPADTTTSTPASTTTTNPYYPTLNNSSYNYDFNPTYPYYNYDNYR